MFDYVPFCLVVKLVFMLCLIRLVVFGGWVCVLVVGFGFGLWFAYYGDLGFGVLCLLFCCLDLCLLRYCWGVCLLAIWFCGLLYRLLVGCFAFYFGCWCVELWFALF